MLWRSTISMTLHSMLARHSRIRGAPICLALTGVRANRSNLSTFLPEQVPIATAVSIMSTVGIAITHSLLSTSARSLWFQGPVVTAKVAETSITMLPVIVITLFQIGRAHVWTPVTNAHTVCRFLLEKKTRIPYYD